MTMRCLPGPHRGQLALPWAGVDPDRPERDPALAVVGPGVGHQVDHPDRGALGQRGREARHLHGDDVGLAVLHGDDLDRVQRLAARLVDLGSPGLVVHHRRRGTPGQEHGGLGVDKQLHNRPPYRGRAGRPSHATRARAWGASLRPAATPRPCQAGGSPQGRCPGTSCPLLSCQRARLAGAAGCWPTPACPLCSCRVPDASSRSTGKQLGLPSDHTREHLVKQVPLSCMFSVLREETARETRGPAPRRVLRSDLAYQVRGDTDAPAVGTRCRCAPACHQ